MNNGIRKILLKALQGEALSFNEGVDVYLNASTANLIWVADEVRKRMHPNNKVTWIIDRNMNITNVCVSRCKFCNFHRVKKDNDTYITPIEEYQQKIQELFDLGGDQLLLQGGMHPDLGIDFYKELFSQLKQRFPNLKLHSLGPPEIAYLAKKDNISFKEALKQLVDSGLDSLPGAGAEILCDEVRKIVSPAKATTQEWLEVMREAHKLNLVTSATMMFGHAETPEQRVEHMLRIREVQDEKPEGAYGFLSFIPWPFQDSGTVLQTKLNINNEVTSEEYIRLLAFSRIFLHNIKNIQASWLTVGVQTGQLCLQAGANDFGSIMIEENVVSSAGASNSLNANQMIQAIKNAGFEPQRRNQKFEWIG